MVKHLHFLTSTSEGFFLFCFVLCNNSKQTTLLKTLGW